MFILYIYKWFILVPSSFNHICEKQTSHRLNYFIYYAYLQQNVLSISVSFNSQSNGCSVGMAGIDNSTLLFLISIYYVWSVINCDHRLVTTTIYTCTWCHDWWFEIGWCNQPIDMYIYIWVNIKSRHKSDQVTYQPNLFWDQHP